MSTVSSVLLVINYYSFIVEAIDSEASRICGIIAIVILVIGNLIHFITAYFAYSVFQEKFFEKLGAKRLFHKMYKWMQFNNTALKASFGFYLIFLLSTGLFKYDTIYYPIIDTILAIALLFAVFSMRKQMREENKTMAYIVLGFRMMLMIYETVRIVIFAISIKDSISENDVFFEYRAVILILIASGTILLLTYSCARFYTCHFYNDLNHYLCK
jgi:hypothetical protein